MVPVDLLVVGAHPDDAEMGCGGWLLAAAAASHRTAICDLTRGEAGTRGTAQDRASESAESARLLGIAERLNLGMPDGRVVADLASRDAVAAVLRRLAPRVVVAPPLEDHHPDHEACARIVVEAAWVSGLSRYPIAGAAVPPAAVPRPTVVHWIPLTIREPDFVVDITAHWEGKLRAARCYRSQFDPDPAWGPPTRLSHPDFLPSLEARARVMGRLIGVRYGEGFTTRGPIPLPDPVAVLGSRAAR